MSLQGLVAATTRLCLARKTKKASAKSLNSFVMDVSSRYDGDGLVTLPPNGVALVVS